MTEQPYKFKGCDVVQLRNMVPTPRMLVLTNQAYDEFGNPGTYASLFWVDNHCKPHTAVLPEGALELVQGSGS